MNYVDRTSLKICTARMKPKDGARILSETDIEYFVESLHAIHEHHFTPEAWDALRSGVYLGGQTESQVIRRGPGSLGLVSERLSPEQWAAAWNCVLERQSQQEARANLEKIERERRDAHIDEFVARGLGGVPQSGEFRGQEDVKKSI
jgi:hypothetical protein